MKKSLFILAATAAFAGANAQSFTESFDTGPTGFIGGVNILFGNTAGGDAMAFSSGNWHARNVSLPAPGTTGWFNNNAVFAPNSGPGALNANFNNSTGSNAIDNYMMSPVRLFKNGDTISFFTRTVTTVAFPDRLILKLSAAGASVDPANFSTTLLTVNSGLTTTGYPSTYTQFTATLSGLPGAGVTGRFAFNYNVPNGGPLGANSDFIGIDDVAYTAVPSGFDVVPNSYNIIEGTPFGGDVASLAASDDNKVFILSEETVPNAEIAIFGDGAIDGLNMTLKVETSASRDDLSQFLYAVNYDTNSRLLVNVQTSSLSDVVTSVNLGPAFISSTGKVQAEIVWIPQQDIETADGWAEAIDYVNWKSN